MGWNNLQTWAKGAIIALVVFYAFVAYAIISGLYSTCHLAINQLGSDSLMCNLLFFDEKGMLTDFSIVFCVGALIGWIVGKFKGDKK